MVGIFFHVKCLVLSVFAFKQRFMLLGLLIFMVFLSKVFNCMILTTQSLSSLIPVGFRHQLQSMLVSVRRYVIYTNFTTLQPPFYVPRSCFLKEVVLPYFEVLQQAAVVSQRQRNTKTRNPFNRLSILNEERSSSIKSRYEVPVVSERAEFRLLRLPD